MTNFPLAGTDRLEDAVVVAARTEREAFGRLFDVCYPEVLRFARRRMIVQAAAEDVTSDVFLQIARGLPTFGGATLEEFRRWMFRIATNARSRQSLQRRKLLGLSPEVPPHRRKRCRARSCCDPPKKCRALSRLCQSCAPTGRLTGRGIYFNTTGSRSAGRGRWVARPHLAML